MSGELLERAAQFQECIERRNAVAAHEVLDRDYALVLVHPARVMVPRDQWLAMLPDYVVHSYRVEEQVADVDEDCATILLRVRMQATVMGQDRSGTFVLTDVWRRRADGWRIWRRHSTPLAAGVMPQA
ncbi:MAG: nuclear transport factor 2 family protein [Dermatophilaceae bacterium]